MVDLHKPLTSELLALYADILDELNRRTVLKTQNNPVADYTEWLVARSLELKLERNSRKGFDATDSNGVRYQIKGRRLHPNNPSRQLGVIRNLKRNEFDFLVAVLFNRDFSLLEAWKISREQVERYARFSSYQNGHILMLEGAVLTAEGTQSIVGEIKGAMNNQN
jgi:hypothetical protein